MDDMRNILIATLATCFLFAFSEVSWSKTAVTATPEGRPLALVYRGPAGCEGCSEALANALISSRFRFRVMYVGPNERHQLTAKLLSKAAIYAQPGGGDDVAAAAAGISKESAQALRHFISSGGHYLGICMGAYLAGTPGFGLWPESQVSYVGRPGSLVEDDEDTVTPIIWRGKKRFMYYQSGNILPAAKSSGDVVLARYPNHDIAAGVYRYGRGAIGLVGPHPEADQSWYDEKSLNDPDGIDADLAHDLIETIMSKSAR